MSRTTVYGWPMVPSETHPGELRAACPKCKGGVVTGGGYAARGTGPGGRGRLGDPGGYDQVWCVDCGHTHRYPSTAYKGASR